MDRTEIYQIDDFQADAMWRMANTPGQIMMSIDVAEDDDEETKARLLSQRQKCLDLEALGLVEDKSQKFVEQITAAAMKIGRRYKVFLITTTGFDMFSGPAKRKVQ